MSGWDVTLLTESRLVSPPRPDWYVRNILTEDALVARALERRGLAVTRVGWDDARFDWTSTRVALFRTTWDYFRRIDEFTAWLDRVAACTTLINSVGQVRWNLDKRYLLDLERAGVRVCPTRVVDAGEERSLAQCCARVGGEQWILKPVVSGAARHTYRLGRDDLERHEPLFRRLVAREAMMLQPFQRRIVSEGELSLMVIGGRYSHAVRKRARAGDFRVQDDFGGTIAAHDATDEEIDFAEAAAAACAPLPAYARVDAFVDNNGRLALGELELIEPELWFRLQPDAAAALARHVVSRWFD